MAEFPIQIKIDVSGVPGARQTATGALDDIAGSAIGLNQSLELVQKGFALLRTAVTLPVNQFRTLFDVSSDLVRAYDEQIVAQTKLITILKATGQGGEEQAKQLFELASALQQVTRFGDDAIVGGQALALGLGVPLEQMERFTKAAVDLAAFLGRDVVGGFQALNIAIQTGSIPRLKQNITDATDPAQRLADVLKFIEQNLGGIAAALGGVGAGPLDQLAEVFGDFRESLGEIVGKSPEFRAFVQTAKDFFIAAIAFVQANPAASMELFGRAFSASFSLAVASVKLFIEVIQIAGAAIVELVDLTDTILPDSLSPLAKFEARVKAQRDLIASFREFQVGDAIVDPSIQGPFPFRQATEADLEKIRQQQQTAREELTRLEAQLTRFKEGTFFGPITEQLQGVVGAFDALADAAAKGDPILSAEGFIDRLIGDVTRLREEFESTQVVMRSFVGDAIRGDFLPGGIGAPEPLGPLGAVPGALQVDEMVDLIAPPTDLVQARFDEFQDIFGSFRDEAADTVGTIASAFDVAVNAMTGAIRQFVLTGKVDFADFARSAVADITAIITRQLILNALVGATGGSTGVIGQLLNLGTRQHGGPGLPARTYLVGERGPELVRFNQPGVVEPNRGGSRGGEDGRALDVAVINVQSEDSIYAAMASVQGRRVILNVLQQDRGLVARLLQ